MAGACAYYNKLRVDDSFPFEEALEQKNNRREELQAAGTGQWQMEKVGVSVGA